MADLQDANMAQGLQLSGGIIDTLNKAGQDESLWQDTHFLQILSLKHIPTVRENANNDRYRMIVSDGQKFTQAMLATQLNHLVKEEKIVKNSVVAVEKLTCNTVQGKRLMIILDLTPMGVCEKIGDPQSANPSEGQQAQQAASSAGPSSSSTIVAPPQQSSNSPGYQKAAAQNNRAVYPIEGLSPYNNKWTIKALCSQKGDVRTFSKPSGEGKVFSVTFVDDSSEIRATAWNQSADQFFNLLQEGRMYYVSKGKVNLAKKKFNNVQNDYEMTLDQNTVIEECPDQADAPVMKYNFVNLAALNDLAKDTTCDVLVVVKETGELSEITSKSTNKQITKRELTVVDRSHFSVRLTLWGKQAEQYNEQGQPVIAFKSVRVGDFGGRTLSMNASSSMQVNPDIPDAHGLRGWFDGVGSTESFTAHPSNFSGSGSGFNRSELKTLSEVKDSDLGMSEKTDYFSTRATITHIKSDNLTYPACQTPSCSKKVSQDNEGWRCEKCDMVFVKPSYRYIVAMSVADYTGQAWLQGFNDVGEVIFGMNADDLMEIRDRDESKFAQEVQKALCKTYNFSCRAKQETFNENTRVRYAVTKTLPLNYKEEAEFLSTALKTMSVQ